MTKRIIVAYFAASIVAMLLSDWALLAPTRTVLGLFLWIALGPIGIIGFATLGTPDVMWVIKNGLYYLAATAGLAACLWFMRPASSDRQGRDGSDLVGLLSLCHGVPVLVGLVRDLCGPR